MNDIGLSDLIRFSRKISKTFKENMSWLILEREREGGGEGERETLKCTYSRNYSLVISLCLPAKLTGMRVCDNRHESV